MTDSSINSIFFCGADLQRRALQKCAIDLCSGPELESHAPPVLEPRQVSVLGRYGCQWPCEGVRSNHSCDSNPDRAGRSTLRSEIHAFAQLTRLELYNIGFS